MEGWPGLSEARSCSHLYIISYSPEDKTDLADLSRMLTDLEELTRKLKKKEIYYLQSNKLLYFGKLLKIMKQVLKLKLINVMYSTHICRL